eukprot:TRINITY_DN392_c0_g1_i1.p2 TRINITY_DN392_c0_g1~~TRINITY_DN392_c0_g1_i1.p2  ORF type:complete len:204 (+),score=62.53 TRINITY_DN392_c0_g1_i1:241-852(+)
MFARAARLAAPLMRSRAVAFTGATMTAGAATWAATMPSVSCSSSVPAQGLPGTRQERTFIAVKPDGVQRALVGDIIARFEKRGYKLVALKMITPSKSFAEQHYADLSKKKFFGPLTDFFSSGPVVAMIWEGEDVIRYGRVILGATMPGDSNPGTVRGDYAVNVGRNVCHGSDSPEGASAEIALWWGEDEINNWSKTADAHLYE